MVDGNYSGAFQGGAGTDQFLVLESNYTRNTTLIPWLGKTAAYLPFKSIARDGQGHSFQAQTLYIAAKPNCRPLVFGDDYKLVLWVTGKVGDDFEVLVAKADEPPTTCYAPVLQDLGDFKTYLGYESRRSPRCRSGRVAAELLINLHAGSASRGWKSELHNLASMPTAHFWTNRLMLRLTPTRATTPL
jgi:hypothetical protein